MMAFRSMAVFALVASMLTSCVPLEPAAHDDAGPGRVVEGSPFDRYDPESPWLPDVDWLYGFGRLEVFGRSSGGWQSGTLTGYISPSDNLIGLAYDSRNFYDYRIRMYEIDFKAIIQLLDDYLRAVAVSDETGQFVDDKEFGRVELPVDFRWKDRNKWYRALPTFEVVLADGGAEPLFGLVARRIRPYVEPNEYVGTIPEIAVYLDQHGARTLKGWFDSARIASIIQEGQAAMAE